MGRPINFRDNTAPHLFTVYSRQLNGRKLAWGGDVCALLHQDNSCCVGRYWSIPFVQRAIEQKLCCMAKIVHSVNKAQIVKKIVHCKIAIFGGGIDSLLTLTHTPDNLWTILSRLQCSQACLLRKLLACHFSKLENMWTNMLINFIFSFFTNVQLAIIQQYGDLYTRRWWPGCYIWYSKEGHGWAVILLSPLFTVPNVTAHPLTASVPTSYYLMWHYNYFAFYRVNCELCVMCWVRINGEMSYAASLSFSKCYTEIQRTP